MSEGQTHAAALLKATFDDAFAHANVPEAGCLENFLTIRANDEPIALMLREVALIRRCPPLTAAPSAHRALRGLMGLRGSVIAVYDIAALMTDLRARETGGWIVLCNVDRSVALLFDELTGYLQADERDIHSARADVDEEAGEQKSMPPQRVIRAEGTNHPIVSIARLMRSVERNARANDTTNLEV